MRSFFHPRALPPKPIVDPPATAPTPKMCVGATYTELAGDGADGRETGTCALRAAIGVGAGVTAAFEPTGDGLFEAVAFAAAAAAAFPRASVPMSTRTYPAPSGEDGHATLTQSPTSRVTMSAVPREAVPIAGLATLGDLRTLADASVTVSVTVSCA
jgi:hypothetical protein